MSHLNERECCLFTTRILVLTFSKVVIYAYCCYGCKLPITESFAWIGTQTPSTLSWMGLFCRQLALRRLYKGLR